MIEFAFEKLNDTLIYDLERLIYLQNIELWDDVEEKINLDWNAYQNMEDMGIFALYTVRDNGKLVGYCSFVVINDPHYLGIKRALQDSIYVLPIYRNKGAGIKIIDYSESQIRNQYNVSSVQIEVNNKIDFSPLLMRKGYEYVGKTMLKRF